MDDQAILRVAHIVKTIGGNRILDDVSLSVQKGRLKVLIGPSGSGKSTLLSCINFLSPPDSGEIALDGKVVNGKSKRELLALRQQVGMIFQEFNLFDHLTALENVRVALIRVKGLDKRTATNRAMEELTRVGLADKGTLYPAQLSGGQKQRVSVARALAMDPKVLLLDEPTSALDPELIGEVLTVIRDLADEGMTMIMATHQISFSASLADEFLFMERGRIVERGAPSVLLARDSGSRTQAFCAKLNELAAEPPVSGYWSCGPTSPSGRVLAAFRRVPAPPPSRPRGLQSVYRNDRPGLCRLRIRFGRNPVTPGLDALAPLGRLTVPPLAANSSAPAKRGPKLLRGRPQGSLFGNSPQTKRGRAGAPRSPRIICYCLTNWACGVSLAHKAACDHGVTAISLLRVVQHTSARPAASGFPPRASAPDCRGQEGCQLTTVTLQTAGRP